MRRQRRHGLLAATVVAAGAFGFPLRAEFATQTAIPNPGNGLGGMYDLFGDVMAMSGDTLVIGVAEDDVNNTADGSAFVFVRTGESWILQARLDASDGTADDRFGNAVAIEGDTIVVGARMDDIGAQNNQGSAYVFVRTNGVWSQQVKLIANDGDGGDWFGSAVAISASTIFVGAEQDETAGVAKGSAYVFVGTNGVWQQQARVVAPDGGTLHQFGQSLALLGDTVIVGAAASSSSEGAAYVFVRADADWTQQAKIVAVDAGIDDRFGGAMALAEDFVVIGAANDDIGSANGQGSAYVFTRIGVGWSQQAKLTTSGTAAFGTSVAISGSYVLIGAPGTTIAGRGNQGAAYVFDGTTGSWLSDSTLIAADGLASDYFGTAVALVGGTAVVGAPRVDVGANDAHGRAYAFRSPELDPPLLFSDGFEADAGKLR